MFSSYNKILPTIISLIMVNHLFASEWVGLGTSEPSEPSWEVNSLSTSNLEISLELKGYVLEQIRDGKNRISFPGGVPILERGAPNLPRMARSIIIPDLAHMELSIIETEFVDIDMSNIEPSKGNLTRDVVPATIPYVYGKSYEIDEFYPSEIAF